MLRCICQDNILGVGLSYTDSVMVRADECPGRCASVGSCGFPAERPSGSKPPPIAPLVRFFSREMPVTKLIRCLKTSASRVIKHTSTWFFSYRTEFGETMCLVVSFINLSTYINDLKCWWFHVWDCRWFCAKPKEHSFAEQAFPDQHQW